MTHDQLQFAISEYLDGTLPVERRAELERVLAGDDSVRRMLEEFRALDGVLSQSLPLPEVRWDRLAAHLSAVVAEHGESMRGGLDGPVDQQTEYIITQYLDGELSAEEHSAIEQRLEDEPAARKVAGEYQTLDRLLRTELPVPAVDHGMLAGRISGAIDESEAAEVRSRWSIGRVRGVASLALAACLVIGIGLVYEFHGQAPGRSGSNVVRVSEIAVLTPDSSASGKPVIDIAVGASSKSVGSRYSFAAAGVVEGEAAQLKVQVADSGGVLPQQDSFLQ